MAIYAKSRRRLKYIDYVGIIEDDAGGYHQMPLYQRRGQLWPIGMSYFSSLEAAKKDCATTSGIREADWSELSEGLIPEHEEGAAGWFAIVHCALGCCPACASRWDNLYWQL